MTPSLHGFFAASAARHPNRTAVIEPGRGEITYRALDELSDRVRDRLHTMDVGQGDRVGIYLGKSIDAVASIYGILKAGAAYVPVDPGAPAARNAFIMKNCQVSALIVENRFVGKFRDEAAALGALPPMVSVEGVGGGTVLARALDELDRQQGVKPTISAQATGDALAYILYTSGSTGKPKGVMLSHENATSFVDWCSEVFDPRPEDRFSSHAPFHFDLSILDIYLPLKHGATLVLIGEDIGKDPVRLAPVIAEEKITCWYSAPSILSLLAQFGNLSRHDYSALRLVLLAGVVSSVKYSRTTTTLL